MNPPSTNSYEHHRCPAEIISHGVWLYFRFCLSYRDVEKLLFTRGVIVTYEAIRKWCLKFGQSYANHSTSASPPHRFRIPPRDAATIPDVGEITGTVIAA
jgi:transposase-like protein